MDNMGRGQRVGGGGLEPPSPHARFAPATGSSYLGKNTGSCSEKSLFFLKLKIIQLIPTTWGKEQKRKNAATWAHVPRSLRLG